MRPLWGCLRPATASRSDVLPAPDGPKTAVTWALSVTSSSRAKGVSGRRKPSSESVTRSSGASTRPPKEKWRRRRAPPRPRGGRTRSRPGRSARRCRSPWRSASCPDNSLDHDSLSAVPKHLPYVLQILLAGQQVALAVHEGHAAALGGDAVDSDVVLGEL